MPEKNPQPTRRGRKTDVERMLRRTTSLAAFTSACPPLAALLRDLGQGMVSVESAEDRLAEVKAYLETMASPSIADAGDDMSARAMVVHAQRFGDAHRRMSVLSDARMAVDTALALAEAERVTQWEALKLAVLRGAQPVSPAVMEVAQGLVNIGVTGKMIETDGAKERLLAAARGSLPKPTPPPRLPVPRPMSELHSLWGWFPREVPGFTMRERDPAEGSVGRIGFFLPPFATIDEISEGFSNKLEGLGTSKEKFNLATDVIRKWAVQNRYGQDYNDPKAQYRAWAFVLGYVHGFLDDVEDFNALTTLSPWSPKALDVRRDRRVTPTRSITQPQVR